MREVLAAAEDCRIGTTLRLADSWAALVALMNMPDKKQDDCLKRLKAHNTATFSESIILTPNMCDDISYDEEKKGYRSEGMRKSREAVHRSSSSHRPKEPALFSDQRLPRHSNLGCYGCREFGHFKRECEVDQRTLHCKTCNEAGHVKEVCPTTINLYRSHSPSLAQAQRPSSERAKIKNPEGQPQAAAKGTNLQSVTPAPASRVIPPHIIPHKKSDRIGGTSSVIFPNLKYVGPREICVKRNCFDRPIVK